jgi:ABC-type multidrug transport system fused ATPase/permease subunit
MNWSMSTFLHQVFQIFNIIFMVGYVNPIFLIMLLPLSFFYKYVQSLYRSSTREFMRLKGIYKSPVISLYQETFSGLPLIRSFARQEHFQDRIIGNINRASLPLYTIVAAERWFSLRLEFLGITSIRFDSSSFFLLPFFIFVCL